MQRSIQHTITLLLALLLTACGGQSNTEAPEAIISESAATDELTDATSAPTEETADSAAIASSGPELVDLPAPSTPSIEVIEITDECRTIRHAFGETCVPPQPHRIVSMDTGTVTDNLLMLDHKPIGSMVYAPIDQGLDVAFPPAIADLAEGIESVGIWPGNIEKVAVLEPDLIIGYTWNFEETYEEYSQIAPTVALSDTNDWRTYLIDTARIIGEEEAANAVISQFYIDAQILDEQLPDLTVSLLRPRTEALLVYGTGAAVAPALNAIGLSLTSVPGSATDLWDGEDKAGHVSYELLPEIDGEAFFIINYDLTPGEMTDLQSSELWESLPVVQDGMAFNVQGIAWTNHGPNGVYRVMEEVEKALTSTE